MSDGLLLTPKEALQVVADAPGAKEKTAADLRKAAQDTMKEAYRADRIHTARTGSNRRQARAHRAAQNANRLHAFANIALAAADELERRNCKTVGEAFGNPLVRFLRHLGVRRG